MKRPPPTYRGGPEITLPSSAYSERLRSLRFQRHEEPATDTPVRIVVQNHRILDARRWRELQLVNPELTVESPVTAAQPPGAGVVRPAALPTSPRGPKPKSKRQSDEGGPDTSSRAGATKR